jgi:hypothetical protein
MGEPHRMASPSLTRYFLTHPPLRCAMRPA